MQYVTDEEYDRICKNFEERVRLLKRKNNLRIKWRKAGCSIPLAEKVAALREIDEKIKQTHL